MKQDVVFDFSGKRFAVVGASSGMGRLVAEEIVESGGAILALDRNAEALVALREKYGDSVRTFPVDVRNKQSLVDAIENYVSIVGKLHGSVYTAGISKTTVLRSFSEEDALDTMNINFWGWINLMAIVSKKKYTEDASSHVVIASAAAHRGESGTFAYSASKAAIMNCVQTFAKEVAKRKCRVNSVSPGFIATQLTADYFSSRGFSEHTIEKHLLGLGAPQDVSSMILYLLSDSARWITGSDFVIDGGYLISD